MGNDEQALTVRNAGSLVPAEDPQKAQERRLKEVRHCFAQDPDIGFLLEQGKFDLCCCSSKVINGCRQRNMMSSSGTSWTLCPSRSSIFKAVVLVPEVVNSTSIARCAQAT